MPTEPDSRRCRAVSEGATPTPTMAHVYAKKPLPPLPSVRSSLRGSPVPAPLNIRKRPSRQAELLPSSASPSSSSSTSPSSSSPSTSSSFPSPSSPPPRSVSLSAVETRTASSASSAAAAAENATQASASSCAYEPGAASPASPDRPFSRRSTVSSATVRRSGSRKVLQLIGQDVDVMVGTSVRNSDPFPLRSLKMRPSRTRSNSTSTSSRPFDLTSQLLHTVNRIPEEDAVPDLEADEAGIASHHTSMMSIPPVYLDLSSPVSCRPLGGCECDNLYCPMHEEASDLGELHHSAHGGLFPDEYHKFAAELAASAEDQQAPTSSFMPIAVDEAAEPRVRRMSAFLSFSNNAQFSRRRRRPDSIEPLPARAASPAPEHVARPRTMGSLAPEHAARPRTGTGVPHETLGAADGHLQSAFDTDSDDERKGRSRWRRDRARDDSARPRAWSRTGDQMRDLLSTAKDKALGVPAAKGERRREVTKNDNRVLMA